MIFPKHGRAYLDEVRAHEGEQFLAAGVGLHDHSS